MVVELDNTIEDTCYHFLVFSSIKDYFEMLDGRDRRLYERQISPDSISIVRLQDSVRRLSQLLSSFPSSPLCPASTGQLSMRFPSPRPLQLPRYLLQGLHLRTSHLLLRGLRRVVYHLVM